MANWTLTELQLDFLRAFFHRESDYFLSGGAALVGFYFGHRETHDLDLFTLKGNVEDALRIVKATAEEIKATVESLQTSPDFRRLLIKRNDESITVDLIREYVFQTVTEKPTINGIKVDPTSEIYANKLCALLSRSEIRDVIDVIFLDRSGLDLEQALIAASKKDTGLTAAQLAWVLHGIKIGDDAELPGNTSVLEFREFLSRFVERLQRLALPKSE